MWLKILLLALIGLLFSVIEAGQIFDVYRMFHYEKEGQIFGSQRSFSTLFATTSHRLGFFTKQVVFDLNILCKKEHWKSMWY